jgi:hypothetical protein
MPAFQVSHRWVGGSQRTAGFDRSGCRHGSLPGKNFSLRPKYLGASWRAARGACSGSWGDRTLRTSIAFFELLGRAGPNHAQRPRSYLRGCRSRGRVSAWGATAKQDLLALILPRIGGPGWREIAALCAAFREKMLLKSIVGVCLAVGRGSRRAFLGIGRFFGPSHWDCGADGNGTRCIRQSCPGTRRNGSRRPGPRVSVQRVGPIRARAGQLAMPRRQRWARQGRVLCKLAAGCSRS